MWWYKRWWGNKKKNPFNCDTILIIVEKYFVANIGNKSLSTEFLLFKQLHQLWIIQVNTGRTAIVMQEQHHMK